MLKLTLLREAQGLSKRRLAALAELDQGQLSKIEAGRVIPYPVELDRLAKALGVVESNALMEDATYMENSAFMLDRLLQFFSYEHLPADKQAVSKPFGELARWICETLPSNPERTVALRKLLEAKDCAVRASIYKGA